MKKARENRSYLWGPTGEQEWSPDMTTGSHVYLYMPTTLFLDCLTMYMYPLHILPVTCLGGMLQCNTGTYNGEYLTFEIK